MLVYIGDYAAGNSSELLDVFDAEDGNALLASLAKAARTLQT